MTQRIGGCKLQEERNIRQKKSCYLLVEQGKLRHSSINRLKFYIYVSFSILQNGANEKEFCAFFFKISYMTITNREPHKEIIKNIRYFVGLNDEVRLMLIANVSNSK